MAGKEAKTERRPKTLAELIAWKQRIQEHRRPALNLIANVILDEAREAGEVIEGVLRTNQDLSDTTGLKPRRARAALRELEDLGYLDRLPTGGKPGEGRQGANLLVARLPDEGGESHALAPPARAGPRHATQK